MIDDKEYKILKKGALGFEDINDESGIKKDNFSDKLEKIDKNKLVKARNLFKENLIDQEEYDLLRKEILGIWHQTDIKRVMSIYPLKKRVWVTR